MRLIDADVLRKTLKAVLLLSVFSDEAEEDKQALKRGEKLVRELVDGLPTIDAVPVVHARWVHEQRYGDSGGWVWRCTACRREAISPIISALKYCNCCGAKMDKREEDENADT